MILDDPFDDPPDLLIPDRSPEPTREQLDVSWVFLWLNVHNILMFCIDFAFYLFKTYFSRMIILLDQ